MCTQPIWSLNLFLASRQLLSQQKKICEVSDDEVTDGSAKHNKRNRIPETFSKTVEVIGESDLQRGGRQAALEDRKQAGQEAGVHPHSG